MASFDSSTVFLAIVALVIALIAYTYSGSRKSGSKKSKAVEAKKVRTVAGPFEISEVAKHSTANDCWIIVDGKVYDITDYILDHPGGDSILANAGGDSSVGVHGPQHPVSMWDVLKLYYIGDVKV